MCHGQAGIRAGMLDAGPSRCLTVRSTGRQRGSAAATGRPAGSPAGPGRGAAPAAPPGRVAEPAHARARGGLQPHHRLWGRSPPPAANLGRARAAGRIHGRRRRAVPPTLDGRKQPVRARSHVRAADRRPAGRAPRRSDATSRPEPDSSSSPAKRASGRPGWSPPLPRWPRPPPSSLPGRACPCPPRSRCSRSLTFLRRFTRLTTGSGSRRLWPTACRT